MTTKSLWLSLVAAVLGVVYAVYFTDWFRRPQMQILASVRPGRPSAMTAPGGGPLACPVNFLFNQEFSLTSVKVVNAEDFAKNKYASPLWHLVSASNSSPTKSIMYGAPVRGMKPAVAGARPETLVPGVPYTLLVEAGRVKAQTNFVTRELASASAR